MSLTKFSFWMLNFKKIKKSFSKLEIGSLSDSYTCSGETSFFSSFEVVVAASEETLCAAQQLLEVWRGSISVNVIWHGTQRQPCGADDSVKPCLWRLHARCCRAVIWSSHAKADRQTALSQAVSESANLSTGMTIHPYLFKAYKHIHRGLDALQDWWKMLENWNANRKIPGKHFTPAETQTNADT